MCQPGRLDETLKPKDTTMCNKNNSHFGRKQLGTAGGAYTCHNCGKRTRETGHEESNLELCAFCLWQTYAINAVGDYVSNNELRNAMRDEASNAKTVQECQAIYNRARAFDI